MSYALKLELVKFIFGCLGVTKNNIQTSQLVSNDLKLDSVFTISDGSTKQRLPIYFGYSKIDQTSNFRFMFSMSNNFFFLIFRLNELPFFGISLSKNAWSDLGVSNSSFFNFSFLKFLLDQGVVKIDTMSIKDMLLLSAGIEECSSNGFDFKPDTQYDKLDAFKKVLLKLIQIEE